MKFIKSKSSLIKVIIRELKRITSKRTLFYIIILLPIFLFFYYPYIYINGIVREIPVIICDMDHSELSRLTTQYIESSASLSIKKYVNSESEIKNEFRKGNIYAAFLIPRDYEKNIKSNKNTSVIVYNNCTNLITANTVLKDATQIIKTISGGVLLKKIRSAGYKYEQALNIINAVKIETKPLYNPNYNYLSYLITGLIPVIFQMIIMITAALLISSEFGHNTISDLILVSEGKLTAIVFGKSIAHLGIHFCMTLFILAFIFPIFKIPLNGSLILSILFTFYFVTASFFFGLLISCLFHDQQFASEIVIFINTPAFIFSGYIFPLSAMPLIHVLFAQVIPFTHYLPGFLKLYQMNLGFESVLSEFLILSVFLFGSMILTFLVLKYQLKKLNLINVNEVVND